MPFYSPFNFPFYYNNFNYTRKSNKPHPCNYHNGKINVDSYSSNPIKPLIEKSQYKEKASESVEASEAFFEIFGLKLYFDDILILCILFFLYTEQVHDDELFICLILLLLT